MKTEDINTLLGGVDVEIIYIDATTELVRVRQIPVTDLPRYMAVQQDECAMAELFCGKEKGWSARLTHESFEKILEHGEGLNRDFLAAAIARQTRRNEALFPGFGETMKQLMSGASLSSAPGLPPKRG